MTDHSRIAIETSENVPAGKHYFEGNWARATFLDGRRGHARSRGLDWLRTAQLLGPQGLRAERMNHFNNQPSAQNAETARKAAMVFNT